MMARTVVVALALLALSGCARVCGYDTKTVLQMQQDNERRRPGEPFRSLADYPETCGRVWILPWNTVGRPGTPSAPIYTSPGP